MIKWLKLAFRLWRITHTKGRIDTDSLEWFALRQLRLMLDWYQCQQSGVKAKNIGDIYSIGFQCHHQTLVSEGGSNRLNNLQTVTRETHFEIHPHLAMSPPDPGQRRRL